MPILILSNAEPLSLAARSGADEFEPGATRIEPLFASSQAREVLAHEMARYCGGLVRGRSFLIAGHRGAGKTTMVDSVVLQFQDTAVGGGARLKPLPVYVQGPMIFAPVARKETAPPLPHRYATTGEAPPAVPDEARDADLEQHVLQEVAQGLHLAVAMEFGARFHLHARRAAARAGNGRRRDVQRARDLAEMAARFQIELTEAPPAARLQEFWRHAGVHEHGLLFDHGRGSQQGLREMVALVGVSHVYQRIAGELRLSDKQASADSRSTTAQTGVDAHWLELAKPMAALLTGGAVTSAAAFTGAGGGGLGSALLLGAATAAGAGLLFKRSESHSHQRERKLDTTFVPDLTTQTLHRVMPELFERLTAAGLAPVFIFDELDKVDCLYERIQPLLLSMKKLFAERAFTCLLVDRGFYEQLHGREEQERTAEPGAAVRGTQADTRPSAYGRNYSYFSHRVFVAFWPEDWHFYLARLLQLAPDTNGAISDADRIDIQRVRWLLLHRSQLNALSLNREIEARRGPSDVLSLPEGLGGMLPRLEITMQVAVELALAQARLHSQLQSRPRLQLPLLDAAYYLTRRRIDRHRHRASQAHAGVADIDLSAHGRAAFADYLRERMNLEDDTPPSNRTALAPSPLREGEIDWLYGVAQDVARSLCAAHRDDLKKRWMASLTSRWKALQLQLPDDALFDALLVGDEAPLKPLDTPGEPEPLRLCWRDLDAPAADAATSLQTIADECRPAADFIREIRALLHAAMADAASAPTEALGLLAQRYRVLPTTPAWADVAGALAEMDQAALGQGNVDALREASRVLQQYAQALREPAAARAVVLCLVLGAALAGWQREPPDSPSRQALPTQAGWETAWQALSDGLHLADTDVAGAEARLTATLRTLRRHVRPLPLPQPRPATATGSGELSAAWPTAEKLQLAVLAAFAAGWKFGDEPKGTEELLQLAWQHTLTRLRALADGEHTNAHATEIACAVRPAGAGTLLPLRLERAGARTWTQLLLRMLDARASHDEAGAPTGPLAAHALERLGMRALDPRLQETLIDALLHRRDDARDEMQGYARQHRLWAGGGSARRAALVLSSDPIPMAEAWPLPPAGGLVLVPDPKASDLKTLRLARWVQEAEPLRVAFESMPADSPEEDAFEAQLKDALGAKASLLRLWLYRTAQADNRFPRLIDPASADELWTPSAATPDAPRK